MRMITISFHVSLMLPVKAVCTLYSIVVEFVYLVHFVLRLGIPKCEGSLLRNIR